MKKILVGLFVLATASIILSLTWPTNPFFTCSDYCPNSRESYMVQAYKGVQNRFLCYALWGKHGIVYGWEKMNYCGAVLK